jgi:uncharacterized repeat protein (TIGR03803 family)
MNPMPAPSLPRTPQLSRILTAALLLAGTALSVSVAAHAQTETTLYDFGTSGPYAPQTGVVFDQAGNLYGVTAGGGTASHGTLYKLSQVDGTWQETTVYNFPGGTCLGDPLTAPVFDQAGNVYGAAGTGGAFNLGAVYKLSPTSSGGFQESILYSFTGLHDGNYADGNLVFDSAGNLYGSDAGGGNVTTQSCQNTSGCGVIYELSPMANGEWKFNLLHTFLGGADGVGPAGLVFGPDGTLYGSAAGAWGGWESPNSPGLIFKLTPTTSGPWKDTIVHPFDGGIGGGLPSTPIFDSAGNIYSSGADGGITSNCWSGYGPIGCGVVLKLEPATSGPWKETVLYAFVGTSDGSQPDSGLVFANGNLYGTTWGGGTSNGGVVFGLSPEPNGEWKESAAHRFTGTDGWIPVVAKLAVDANGNLYGTTYSGGPSNWGVVFEITP